MNDQIHIELAGIAAEETRKVKKDLTDLSEKDRVRFQGKIDKTGGPLACWLWTGGKYNSGYGLFKCVGMTCRAHRISYLFAYGNFDPKKLVLHACDTPACVNPNHLFLGTYDDNNKDKEKKGRGRRLHGSDNPRAKLTETDVVEMRRLFHDEGWDRESLGVKYNVSPVHVWCIVNRKAWAHI